MSLYFSTSIFFLICTAAIYEQMLQLFILTKLMVEGNRHLEQIYTSMYGNPSNQNSLHKIKKFQNKMWV